MINFPKKIKIKESQNEKNSEEKIILEENEKLSPEGQLAIDFYETEDKFLIIAPIAGVSVKNIEILIDKDMLIIKGNRPNPDNISEKKDYFYQECYWGPFSRKIILPENADTCQIEAESIKGILIIKSPKIKKEEKMEIKVK